MNSIDSHHYFFFTTGRLPVPAGGGTRLLPGPERRSNRPTRRIESPNSLPAASLAVVRIRSRCRTERSRGLIYPAPRHRSARRYNPPKRALLTSDSTRFGVRLAASPRGPLAIAGDRECRAPASSNEDCHVKTGNSGQGISARPCSCGAGPGRRRCLPMQLYHNVSGWTVLFALLTLGVVCDVFAIWMGWLSTH